MRTSQKASETAPYQQRRTDHQVMPLEKAVLTSHTAMSLDERFTHLRRVEPHAQQRGVARGRIDFRQSASIKNRRLALQMARRPAVVAALTRGVLQGRTDRSVTNGIAHSNLIYSARSRRGNFVRGGGRGGGRQLRRSQSLGRLSRSQSLQSLNRANSTNFRGRGGAPRGGRGRGRSNPGRRSQSLSRMGKSQSLQSLNTSVGFRGRDRRGRGRGRGKNFSVSTGFVERRRNSNRRGRGGNSRGGINTRQQNNRGRNSFHGGRRGRGGGGRGGRRGRGGKWQNNPPPSKETLDQELDQYMSASRATLDKEIDSYMNQTEEKWE